MVTGQVADYTPAKTGIRARVNMRPGSPGRLASITWPFKRSTSPRLARVEDRILENFRSGGGVPYSAYPRFQGLPAEDSAAIHDAALIETIVPAAPDLIERLQAGIEVAEIGCGSGHAISLLARAFPGSRSVGFDFLEDICRQHARRRTR